MISTPSSKVITTHVLGSTRNLLLGASLGYSIQTEKYIDIPIIILFPSIYTGYQLYTNKEQIVNWLEDTRKRMRYRFF